MVGKLVSHFETAEALQTFVCRLFSQFETADALQTNVCKLVSAGLAIRSWFRM